LPGLHGIDPNRSFDDQVRDALVRVLYAAPSELCLLPFQDLLGTRERVNVPGTVNDSNWTYRMPMDVDALRADHATTARLAQLAGESGRLVGYYSSTSASATAGVRPAVGEGPASE
jgi:4-alpha-glucanotransferase